MVKATASLFLFSLLISHIQTSLFYSKCLVLVIIVYIHNVHIDKPDKGDKSVYCISPVKSHVRRGRRPCPVTPKTARKVKMNGWSQVRRSDECIVPQIFKPLPMW